MRAYREILDPRAAPPSPRRPVPPIPQGAHGRRYLELEKSTLDQRSFLAAQRELLDACLLTAEGFLRTARPPGE